MRISNGKGEEFESQYSHREAVSEFLATAPEDHWVWYHVHRYVQPKTSDRSSKFLADSFMVALGYGLKRPMIRVHYLVQRFKVYLSRRGTLCLKAGFLTTGERLLTSEDPEGAEEYVGCWVDGRFLPNKGRTMYATETLFLKELDRAPVGFLAACSRDMGRCCYCNLPLDDPRSTAMGYGPVCARRWGLPWGEARDGKRIPSFAEQYDPVAAALLEDVRRDPNDEGAWGVFGDWLEERGLPRCEMPKTGVTIPR